MSFFNTLMQPWLKKQYEKAVSGDHNAQYTLANYYKIWDPEKSFKWFCYLANSGSCYTMNEKTIPEYRELKIVAYRELGHCYLNGKGTEKNYVLAIAAFRQIRGFALPGQHKEEYMKCCMKVYNVCQKELARSQDAATLYAVGCVLTDTDIMPPGITTRDVKRRKADEYFRKAADMGHGDAFFATLDEPLSRLRYNLCDSDYSKDAQKLKEIKELVRLLDKAAERGSARAACQLGSRYTHIDPDKAIWYYTMAAKNTAPESFNSRHWALEQLVGLYLSIDRYDDALACYRELEIWHPVPWLGGETTFARLWRALYVYEHRNEPIPQKKIDFLTEKTEFLMRSGKFYEEQIRNREDMRP